MKIEKIEKKDDLFLIKVNNEEYLISAFLKLKYQLSLEKDMTLLEIVNLIQEAQYEKYDKILAKKLKKTLTEYEVKVFLENEGCNLNISNKLIGTYKKYGYISDYNYIIKYIETKRNNQGKLLLKQNLLIKGINEKLIDSILKNHNESIDIEIIINKKIKTIKNKTKSQLIKTIYQSLVNKGFDEKISEALILKLTSNLVIDEEELLNKAYLKIAKKTEDKDKIIKHLLAKGFDYSLIKKQLKDGE